MKSADERLKFLYPKTEAKPCHVATSRRAQRLVSFIINHQVETM